MPAGHAAAKVHGHHPKAAPKPPPPPKPLTIAQALAAAGTAPKDCETAGPWCVKGANWVAFDADL
eukprot:gene10311-25134_t